MQPLNLHIEGLHSFRKPVDIDLAHLGQHGLFGIFGSIGSGKSTILDAMTLALYGTIDRLPGRSRRGIINHHCARCEVRFRFRVGEVEWEAQRAYRKDKEGNAVRIHSRIARLEALGMQVVADKEREVNDKIESLLGLSAADFMRAVVLPQGRFMQFLQLQGTDRRRMLQRIFHLEPFGEGLRTKVKAETERVMADLHRAMGELDGLGDASAASVQEAKTHATAARERSRALRDERQVAIVEALDAERAMAHQTALQDARRASEQHASEAARFEEQRAAIVRARRVRPVLAARDRFEAIETEREAAKARSESLKREAEVARQAASDAHEAAGEALRKRQSEGPELGRRREGLARAARLVDDLAAATARVQKLSQKRGQLRRRQAADEREAEREERALEKVVARRTELRTRYADLEVAPDLRQRVRTAESSQIALEEARKRSGALADQLARLRHDLDEAVQAEALADEGVRAGRARESRIRTTLGALDAQAAHLEGCTEAADRLRSAGLVDRLREADDRVQRARGSVERATSLRDEARAELDALSELLLAPERLAGVLVRDLDPGAECQVCGSTEHPALAHPVEPALLVEGISARARAEATLETRQAHIADAQADLHEALGHHQSLLARIPTAVRGLADLEAFLERHRQAVTGIERARRRLENAQRALIGNLHEARALHSSASAQRVTLAQEVGRLEREQSATLDDEGRAWGEMTAALGEMTLFDLPRVAASIVERDRERGELQPTLDQAERELARSQTAWERRRERMAARHADLERVRAEHDAADTQRQDLLDAVNEAAPGGAPDVQLAEVERQLAQLEEAVVQTQQSRDDAQRVAARTQAAAAAARQHLESTVRRADQARTGFETAAAQAEIDPEQLEPADAMPDADLEALQGETEQWFERRAALTHQRAALESIDLPPMTMLELERAQQRRDTAEAAWRDAEAEAARADERAHTIRARAERFAVIKRAHDAHRDRADRLGTLARLLRGDRFVEYVANDYLHELAAAASRHLDVLTRGRYALTLDESSAFLMVDLDAAGAVRPASSLSGGETFITSLALALALSTQVQRHSDAALEFFFLDEGFGSLDPESLDRVMSAIERLTDGSRVIGLISHIGAVRERVPRALSLTCPRDGSGTRIECVDS